MLKKNLIIIPARKNSKRIKNKNRVKVLNKPLILWTINYAKKLKKKNFDLVVTSDCKIIKKICSKEKVSFLERPKKISNDYTSMHEVIFHTVNNFNQEYKYIILLQPTSPLRKLDLVFRSIKILDNKKKFDSVIHLAKDSSFSGKVINNFWIPDYNLNKRSQDIKDKFLPTGNIFVYRSYLYKNKFKFPKKTYGLISNNEKWVDIDHQEDLMKLNFYLKDLKNRKILLRS
jgi:CMP-N,N'-diacetyllegionaminic acid synthase